jgi:hypothetical protein
MECVIALILKNPNCLKETGQICCSPIEKNIVMSNAVGCAACHGHVQILAYLLKADNIDIEFLSTEIKVGNKYELQGCSPLIIAVANAHIKCINLLIKALVNIGKKPDLLVAIELSSNRKEIQNILIDK